MGCNASKPSSSGPLPPGMSGLQDVHSHIPRNRADKHGVPLQQVTRDIDRATLMAALNYVSEHVAGRGHFISVAAVGGAVNTLLLRSQQTTYDIDIFGSDFSNDSRRLLDEAMQSARANYPGLGTDWLNTETQMWMSGTLHRELTLGAREQDVVVFRGAGLEILAAPWEYAFSAKISRLLTGGSQVKPYDLDDAVVYIHQFLRTSRANHVSVATAMAWSKSFHTEMTSDILLNRVNKAYQQKYGAVAFV
ncbi:hypothetical protein CAC42_6481 [Sphaceloma murrayae]|uniref:DUF7582 domain-containing protein n=1 Tax=Sphaceloma murrayae TaxID=2082308 RepID=A0A2K1QFP6_9PEZI|nr:hypothetical protein CAC42_6481 [Sphaceloma murrayae]